jgi:hypothetical protein
MSDAAFQRTNECDMLLAKVRAAIVRGEACCHVNDQEWDRSWWQDSLDAAIRLRAMADAVPHV